MLYLDDDGVARHYEDTYDITIHCESEEEQEKAIELIKSRQWIPCSKRMPEMHDAGILKKVGIKQRSKKVYITIEVKRNDGSVERITDADAELRDGEWYSNALRWLKAAGKKIEVTAWMPYPEPYNPEGDDKHGTD